MFLHHLPPLPNSHLILHQLLSCKFLFSSGIILLPNQISVLFWHPLLSKFYFHRIPASPPKIFPYKSRSHKNRSRPGMGCPRARFWSKMLSYKIRGFAWYYGSTQIPENQFFWWHFRTHSSTKFYVAWMPVFVSVPQQIWKIFIWKMRLVFCTKNRLFYCVKQRKMSKVEFYC